MSLDIGYWNIHGHTSTCIGDKLCNPEFLDLLKGKDVVGLGELHAENEVSIPGFVNIKQKNREKKFMGPKIAGGLAVFVREEVNHLVKVVDNTNPDSIWIRIKKEKFNGKHDIFIGTYYISPESNAERNKKNYDFFSAVNNELSVFNKKGLVLLQGDFNGRIGVEQDFVGYDKSDEELGIQNLDNQRGRNSEDKKINSRGKDLLDICKVNDLLVVNGRTTGDIFGKFTSHNWNGSSVVDCCIASNSILDNITNFNVGPYIPWLSDHCLISSTLFFGNASLREEIEQMNPKDLHPGWIWNETDRENYCESLSLDYFKEKFGALENSPDITPNELAKEIKLLLMENTKTARVREKKKMKNEPLSDPWFDTECKMKKENLNNIGNKIRKSPENQCLRSRLSVEKKSLRGNQKTEL